VRDDEDIVLFEICGSSDQRRQVIALVDLGQALDRDDAQLDQGKPVTRRPVCVL
jgi:hypothetical protein